MTMRYCLEHSIQNDVHPAKSLNINWHVPVLINFISGSSSFSFYNTLYFINLFSFQCQLQCISFLECIPLLHIFISNSKKPKMVMMSKHPNNIILLSWHIHHKSQNGVCTVVTFVHQYNFISYISLSLKEFQLHARNKKYNLNYKFWRWITGAGYWQARGLKLSLYCFYLKK